MSSLETKGSVPDIVQWLSFRWVRGVDAMTVSIESSCPISAEKSGQLASNRGKNIGPKIRANGTRGAESPFCSDSTAVWLRGNPSEYQAALSRPHRPAFRITSNGSALSTGHLE
jgi:hypothetical protein